MTRITTREVQTRSDLNRFIRFQMDLYRGNKYYVPSLIADEKSTLRPGSPAQDDCDSRLFLAFRNREVVGRIAAIINHTANRSLKTMNVRFGWFDLIDHADVAAALFDAVEEWGCAMGMHTVSGPFGYTGFDKVGLLVKGYDSTPTIATLYNFPYYDRLVVGRGFEKEMDMLEYLIRDLRQVPQRLVRFADLLRKRSPYRVMEIPSIKAVLNRKDEVLDMIEEIFSDMYDGFPMTPTQREFYASKFLPYLNPNLAKIVLNARNEMVAYFIAMPNLSRAFQKARGHLFPTGFAHIWRALRPGNNKLLDFCVGGVRKKFRRLGVDVLMGVDLFQSAVKLGFEMAETNPENETNSSVRREWRDLDYLEKRRRRVYIKSI